MTRWFRSIGLLISIVAASACGSKTESATTVCTPGVMIACTGVGGCSGGQACKADGSGYDVCDCGGGGDSALADSQLMDADVPAETAFDSTTPLPDSTADSLADSGTADTSTRRTYSGTFTTGVAGAGSSQCADWSTFRASLAFEPGSYAKVTLSGSKDPIGITCTGSDADVLCRSLASGSVGNFPCGGTMWRTGNCGDSTNIEVTANTTSTCACNDSGYTLRPCFATASWGGINTATCNPPSQTITITCE